jgi:hypothetical protein
MCISGVAGAKAQHSFRDAYGPAEAVPLLQSQLRLSFPQSVKPNTLFAGFYGPAESRALVTKPAYESGPFQNGEVSRIFQQAVKWRIFKDQSTRIMVWSGQLGCKVAGVVFRIGVLRLIGNQELDWSINCLGSRGSEVPRLNYRDLLYPTSPKEETWGSRLL